MLKKENFVFIFKEESVVIYYRNQNRMKQYLSINAYCSYYKHNYKKFISSIINSSYKQYDNINDIYKLVYDYNLCVCSTYQPTSEIIKKSKKYYKQYKDLYKGEGILC